MENFILGEVDRFKRNKSLFNSIKIQFYQNFYDEMNFFEKQKIKLSMVKHQ